MRCRIVALTVAAVLFLPNSVRGQDLIFDSLRDYLESLRIQAGIPGLSVAIVGTNDILWEHAFGYQDVEQAIPVRTDTPFHIDGLTQIVTTALVLRCVEDGYLSLDDNLDQFDPESPYANSTIRNVLTHTFAGIDGLHFHYQPERLEPVASAIESCTGDSFQITLGTLFDQLGMTDSVPGLDFSPFLEDSEDNLRADRYESVSERLAVSYAVGRDRRPTPSLHPTTTLTPGGGLISSVRDLARFDVELRNGVMVTSDSLASAWQAPTGRDGEFLPHGLGWFVQTYAGEPVVWQFGVAENASSSVIAIAPTHGLTLILLANSDDLVKPFAMETGDLMLSPFARLFMELFLR